MYFAGNFPGTYAAYGKLVAISFNTSLQKYGGDMAVASMSILNSVMQFVMPLLPGLVQGAQPLLSYNLGSKNDIDNIKPLRKSVRYGSREQKTESVSHRLFLLDM